MIFCPSVMNEWFLKINHYFFHTIRKRISCSFKYANINNTFSSIDQKVRTDKIMALTLFTFLVNFTINNGPTRWPSGNATGCGAGISGFESRVEVMLAKNHSSWWQTTHFIFINNGNCISDGCCGVPGSTFYLEALFLETGFYCYFYIIICFTISSTHFFKMSDTTKTAKKTLLSINTTSRYKIEPKTPLTASKMKTHCLWLH